MYRDAYTDISYESYNLNHKCFFFSILVMLCVKECEDLWRRGRCECFQNIANLGFLVSVISQCKVHNYNHISSLVTKADSIYT